ncbi:MAG TPA: potassium-transporting ATPase subunit KdpB [Methanotrichaceae archaeon]|nr:potassium-transporting ATPase subunit KdpB [Methanotrichaceae archaeon]
MPTNKKSNLWQADQVKQAIKDSIPKLDPRSLWRSPVMLAVEMGAVLTTLITVRDLIFAGNFKFDVQITIWLWFTILFANFAEALAEGRGRAQAETLRQARSEALACKLLPDGTIEQVSAMELKKGDLVLAKDGDIIPSDGEVAEGVALVDESAITGESAPVVRESGGELCGVTGGTRVLSGQIKVRITADPGETFLDKMIGMVEGAKRQKTPNEQALEILLIGLTGLFIVVVVSLNAFAGYMGLIVSVPVLVALLVCLMPTTIGGLLPAIGIAGMDRLLQHNVIALSGRAVEASGDVDVVLMDKTGTITLGNRMATEFIPASGVTREEVAEAAMLSSLADDTPEGRSIVDLSKETLGIRGRDIRAPAGSSFLPFSAETRMSGINLGPREIRKGAQDAIVAYVESRGGQVPGEIRIAVDAIAKEGGTPLVVAEGSRVLGAVRLKDVLKTGIRDRLSNLRKVGIRSVMITGDNSMTAAAIAAEAGIDDFIGQARPEAKLEAIRRYQKDGHLVAMIGDGTNDAPALAQADVAVAMNAGTQAAREAANMVDLDSNPAKLLDIVEIGKQILITRGALTTFSVANDLSKYFAILPAIFAAQYPMLNILNIMQLATPTSAVLSAIIFNAIIIPMLIPLSLRGVRYTPTTAQALLRRNLLIYGLGGLAVPFIAIKLIDILVVLLHLE